MKTNWGHERGARGDLIRGDLIGNFRVKKVIIIGGGFAGLSAAVELISAGYHVTLAEQRRFLGGRAYSFPDRKTGLDLDNGQHILMGCYKNTLRFLEKIGVTDKLYVQKNLHVDFLDTNGNSSKLDCLPLPAPLHIASGILRFSALPITDRLRMLRVAGGMLSSNSKSLSGDCTVSEWLNSLGQPKEAQDTLWNIITMATLNENPDKASATLFKSVLKQALFANREGSSIVLPAAPLSRLYVDAAENFIRQRAGTIEKGCIASEIMLKDKAVTGIRLQDGRVLKGDYYISAVPYGFFQRILPDKTFFPPFLKGGKGGLELSPSPIISIHLLFNNPITDYRFAALLHSPIQWIFNKEKIYRDRSYRGLLSIVISGAHQYIDVPSEKLVDLALGELKKVLPGTHSAKLLYSKVIKERAATFSPVPGVNLKRPSQKTPIQNLFLAGDWTNTGLPATIEGAIISGYQCATLITETDS